MDSMNDMPSFVVHLHSSGSRPLGVNLGLILEGFEASE